MTTKPLGKTKPRGKPPYSAAKPQSPVAEPPIPGSRALRDEIRDACDQRSLSLNELTVLSNDLDPYRQDTPAGHRVALWFMEQVNRFVPPDKPIHIRGLHYRISSAGNIRRPTGELYLNTDPHWEWLGNDAAKAARWLGYVPFDRIIDERNNPPHYYLLEDYTNVSNGRVISGGFVESPKTVGLPIVAIIPPLKPNPPTASSLLARSRACTMNWFLLSGMS